MHMLVLEDRTGVNVAFAITCDRPLDMPNA